MTAPDIAVVGGGLLGRMLAWRAALSGLTVSLYDANDRSGNQSTAWVAAAMVAPQSETVDTDPELVAMGRRSLKLWPEWLKQLPSPVHYSEAGTLLIWQRTDAGEARRFETVLRGRNPHAAFERLNGDQLSSKEPALGNRFREGLYLPGEANVDNRQLLPAVADALDVLGVKCHWSMRVEDTQLPDAALVIDCRGKSAKSRWKELRGVRGELVRLLAPGVELHHMIRLLHPRYQLYLISRPEGKVLVGATTIETDDSSPVSVRGVLELLSAAYFVMPELAEARILELNCDCRPALPDNRPAVRYTPDARLLEVNGLYRHGFMLSPAVIEEVLTIVPELLQNPASDFGPPSRWPLLDMEKMGLTCQSS